jgi:DNA-binding FrmR family transcriptional regulator
VSVTPVVITGSTFTWTSFFTGGTFLALLGLLIRQIGPWRKQTTDATDKLIGQLTARLETVEGQLGAVQKQLATERRLHFIATARLEARHAAQRALDRHKFNNADANLDALLRILEVSPEKASEAAGQARRAREEQRKNEQMEAAEIHKAEILAVEIAEKELDEQDKKEPVVA